MLLLCKLFVSRVRHPGNIKYNRPFANCQNCCCRIVNCHSVSVFQSEEFVLSQFSTLFLVSRSCSQFRMVVLSDNLWFREYWIKDPNTKLEKIDPILYKPGFCLGGSWNYRARGYPQGKCIIRHWYMIIRY